MNAWQWWSWSLLIILQLTQADEIDVYDNAVKDVVPNTTTNQERQRRDVEWPEDVEPTERLLAFPKRDPILSRWGGQRLSDLLYYKRRPAFSSWGGKRGPAFSSWGGKRSMPDSTLESTQNETLNSSDTNHEKEHIKSTEYEPDANSEHSAYEIIKNEILKDTHDKNKFLHTQRSYINAINSLPTQEFNNIPVHNIYPHSWNAHSISEYQNVGDKVSDNFKDYENNDFDYDEDDDVPEEITSENGNIGSEETADKRAAPSFNSWGGKRAAILSWGSKWIPEFNHWQGKKATAFNSWGGKRAPAFNSWGGKRAATAFNSWGGKRTPAFNSWGGKRATTAFNSWGGKRAPAFNSWGGKRSPAFNSWGGKRSPAFNSWGGKRAATAFNSWGGKRATTAFNSWGGKRAPAFNSWGGKRAATAFNSWGGKRATAFNSWGGKRAPAFNSWGGKRAPAFNSWGGKRAPAFNSWGGKREVEAFNGYQNNQENNDWNDTLQPTENSHRVKRSADHVDSDENPPLSFNPWKQENGYRQYDEKRAHAFNSWGGKRATAFNSWGGKRATAFNSWGGKRATAFNSWGGKRATAFNSWGGKRTPEILEDGTTAEFNRQDSKEQATYDWGDRPTYDEGVNDKRATPFNKDSGKRLPAFHSWGGKRFKSLTTLTPNENTIHFLGSGTDQNHLFDSSSRDDSEYGNNPNEDDKYDLKYDDAASQNNYDHVVKRAFQFRKQDAGGKRDPAFFSWGGKRSGERADYDDDRTIEEKFVTTDDMENEDDEDEDEESVNINKRQLELKYNPEYFFEYSKSNYEDKRRPIFSSWGGKRNAMSSGATLNEEKTYGARKKRYVDGGPEKAIALIVSGNDVMGNGIRSTTTNEIYSVVPSGTTICCIKRAQYGDRNLFMQMLLNTKSFRDLSWPTIRPIRRGADFYSWGGKRSSL